MKKYYIKVSRKNTKHLQKLKFFLLNKITNIEKTVSDQIIFCHYSMGINSYF